MRFYLRDAIALTDSVRRSSRSLTGVCRVAQKACSKAPAQHSAPTTELVRRGDVIGLVQKLAYCEINNVRSQVERSVVACRHNHQLATRQAPVYLGVLFDRCEVVVASHDEYRY
jgi:hypothetical protein